uniref:Uncharacterized protein n=1 Tax=Anguilla anguilla TaxID=7936 RepID=A0A0E9W6X5_ANGAN
MLPSASRPEKQTNKNKARGPAVHLCRICGWFSVSGGETCNLKIRVRRRCPNLSWGAEKYSQRLSVI